MMQLGDDPLRVVQPGEPLPSTWGRCVVLHGTGRSNEDWTTWYQSVLDQLRGQHYQGCVFIAPPLDSCVTDTEPDRSIEADLRWLSLVFGYADVIVAYVDLSISGINDIYWLARCRQVSTRKLILQARGSRIASLGATRLSYDLFHEASFVRSEQEAAAVVCDHLRAGSLRSGAERNVPLEIWRTSEFSAWYTNHRTAGNELEKAEPIWLFRSTPELGGSMWYWAMHVSLHISNENRSKTNEPILSRPNTAACLLYRLADRMAETEIVLVKEFRSPSVANDGYVWELPSGSAEPSLPMLRVAKIECKEEVGLDVDEGRWRFHGSRQLASTMSIHQTFLFSAALSAGELEWVYSDEGLRHGAVTTEQTYPEVLRLAEIEDRGLLDWSMLGMVYHALSMVQGRE